MRSLPSLFWKLLSYLDYFVMSHLDPAANAEVVRYPEQVVTVLSNIMSH